ncbi:hypothetical protein I7I51_03284 [Histoplasma capsulatum]|uniref:Uncharacterized protein n=1 Tax=Ajellomyces capsulatus TaxID=5037 RepID=A0A8A1M9E1_AJECA|nr:hypothetical protein I7I51_03284 [Histoplasma capsulatum]
MLSRKQQAIRKKQTSRYSCAEERLANGDLGNGSNMYRGGPLMVARCLMTPSSFGARHRRLSNSGFFASRKPRGSTRVDKGQVPGSWFRDSVLNTANYGPMALVFASHHWHHMRSPSQANNGGTNLARKKLQVPTAAPNSSETYIYLWMPFLLDLLFLSIFTLSPASGHWFIDPRFCPFHPLGFWKHNRRQSLFLVQPTDIPAANRSVRLCASAILPSKLQETFEVLTENPIQEHELDLQGTKLLTAINTSTTCTTIVLIELFHQTITTRFCLLLLRFYRVVCP